MRPHVPEGVEERVVHLRRPVGVMNNVLIPTEVLRMIGLAAKPHGGLTIVILVKEREVIGHGWSLCMDTDNYNKRLGRDIALGRALRKVAE